MNPIEAVRAALKGKSSGSGDGGGAGETLAAHAMAEELQKGEVKQGFVIRLGAQRVLEVGSAFPYVRMTVVSSETVAMCLGTEISTAAIREPSAEAGLVLRRQGGQELAAAADSCSDSCCTTTDTGTTGTPTTTTDFCGGCGGCTACGSELL
jgi:hypothetical protein